jgi:dihydroorotate dehydrogenase
VLYRLVRSLLFRLPPERAHRLAFAALRPLERLAAARPTPPPPGDPRLAQNLFGLTFANPIGLAAGLDKNAELPHLWPRFGFGHAELGTVTARPQPGNPPPRLFRLPEQRALINRMGFNNDGAAAVAARLARSLHAGRPGIPIGLNIGKSKLAPLDAAADDYCESYRQLAPLADYVTVNVSSPNTPGLRSLQSHDELQKLLRALGDESRTIATAARAAPPLLVKLAPDLADDDLRDLAAIAADCGAAGLIATNTTVRRDLLPAGTPFAAESGGLSGAPLAARATEVVRVLHTSTRGRLPIIGVGGVFDAADAYAKIRAGASLVQVYTAFIYAGPGLPRRLCSGLADRLERDGFATIGDAVGSRG